MPINGSFFSADKIFDIFRILFVIGQIIFRTVASLLINTGHLYPHKVAHIT